MKNLKEEYHEYIAATFPTGGPEPGSDKDFILRTAFIAGALAGCLRPKREVLAQVNEWTAELKKLPEKRLEF